MAEYLEVIDGVAVGGIYNDNPNFPIPDTWVSIDNLDPQPSIGWSYDGTNWTQPEDERVTSRQREKDSLLAEINDEIEKYNDTKALQDAGESGYTASMTDAEHISALKYREDLRAWDVSGSDDAPTRS